MFLLFVCLFVCLLFAVTAVVTFPICTSFLDCHCCKTCLRVESFFGVCGSCYLRREIAKTIARSTIKGIIIIIIAIIIIISSSSISISGGGHPSAII
jgi:hypothetical protein